MYKALVLILIVALATTNLSLYGEPTKKDSKADKSTQQKKAKLGKKKRAKSKLAPGSVWLGYGHDDSPEILGATYLKTTEEIRSIPLKGSIAKSPLSYPKSSGLRIVGTGHSWMRPGYKTLPIIVKAAGLEQQLRTNLSTSEKGAARMMWELENGILSSHGKAVPICMSAITTGKWDVMMWGSFHNDRPEFYCAWIDFCLKYNPKMEFYIFNGWPRLKDGFSKDDKEPKIENYHAKAESIKKTVEKKIAALDKLYPNKVHILPTCEAMLGTLELYFKGSLPGIKGLNKKTDGKSPSIWHDGGHLGERMDRLEGYVFYATLYKKSPELITNKLPSHNDELDKKFRKIAWQAVINNPLSDVTDKNGNGIGDEIE